MLEIIDEVRFPAGTRCHSWNFSTGEEGYFVYGESPEEDEFVPFKNIKNYEKA